MLDKAYQIQNGGKMMEIYAYQVEDYQEIMNLLKQENWVPFFDTFKDQYKQALTSSHTYVMKDKDKTIAYIRAISDGFYLTYIGELIVLDSYKRRGVGSKLIKHIKQVCSTPKLELISDADQFYQKNDFKPVGTGQRVG